ncbi:hypothetical protein AAZR93_21710, partial [Providencia sp. Je.9.19]
MNLQNIPNHFTPRLRVTCSSRKTALLNALLWSGVVMGSVLTSSAEAAIALDRTRVVFDGDHRSVSLNVSNQNK